MSRIRHIKPEFFLHEDVACLTYSARLLFIGLWCLADKAGRLKDKPARIKAQVFPYDRVNVEVLLTALDSSGFIHRYTVDGEDYIEIVNFAKHQRFNNEAESVLPPVSEGYVTPSVELAQGKGKGRGYREREGIRDNAQTLPRLSDFDSFWSSYPRKVGKRKAQAAYLSALKRSSHDTIMSGLASCAKGWKDPTYIPHPTTWLNRDGWLDELAASVPDRPKPTGKCPTCEGRIWIPAEAGAVHCPDCSDGNVYGGAM